MTTTSTTYPMLALYSASTDDELIQLARSDAESLRAGRARRAFAGTARRRLAVAAADEAGLLEGLSFFAEGIASPRWVSGTADGAADEVAWCFGGHGSQWDGMGQALMSWFPDSARVLSGVSVANGSEAGSPGATQPLIFAVQVAIAQWLLSQGLRPAAVIGHSLGEVAAAHIAGVLTFADAMRVVLVRSRLLDAAGEGGAMATIGIDHETAAVHCAQTPGTVVVAAHSAPQETVVTGEQAATDALVARLREEGVRCRPIRITAASHSPFVEPVLPQLRAELSDIEPRTARTPWLSTVDLAGPPLGNADYWARNLREPVRFAEAVSALADRGIRGYVEIGPHPVLLKPLRDTLQAAGVLDPLLAATGHRGSPEPVTLTRTLGALYTRGSSEEAT
ncbi:acyltransferase domain-containing protein [Parafrankia discariae]|uniref:acyltransferase domain-containing protein n=1 Tax=Parafrankia discariae TaxID=365528 RepID=UPI00037004D7|nr:acyltransferase domain-containing protein [Parafrankia discariae]